MLIFFISFTFTPTIQYTIVPNYKFKMSPFVIFNYDTITNPKIIN